MARTLGQVRIALLKTPAGAGYDLELLTERINARYFEILSAHPWTRLHGSGVIQTVAMYNTGTLAITNGLTAVTLTGGSFPTDLNGGRLRVDAAATWYTFTRLTASTGTLDRAFEGTTVTTAAFQLWQPIYAVPTDCDVVDSINVPSRMIELDKSTQEAVDEADPSRREVSSPRTWAEYKDSAANVARIELWPGPTLAEGLPIRYRATGTRFDFTDASTEFPDWVDTDTLSYGVEAELLTDKGNLPAAAFKEQRFQIGLKGMIAQDCQRMANLHLDMTDRYTVHRVLRELDIDRIDRRSTLINSFR